MISGAGARIAVILGQPPSGSVPDFTGSPPVTPVHVASAQRHAHDGAVYLALIDTGTDVTAIDKMLAANIGADLSGNGVTRGFGGIQSGVQRAHIFITLPAANVIYEAKNAAVLDFRGQGQSFDLILGRDFLKHCRLTVDGPNSDYVLEWVDWGHPSK